MKYLGIVVVLGLLFTACPNPVQNNSHQMVQATVMNSLWQQVKVTTITKGVRDLNSEVAAYNAANISDQWFVVEGVVPGLDQAPPANIYIVDKITHAVITSSDGVGGVIAQEWLNWPRAKLVSNFTAWQNEAVAWNGLLYIDNIPPPPPPSPALTAAQLYAKYSIYVVDIVSGAIIYQEHCSDSFVPADWPGWTLDTFFAARIQSWAFEAQGHRTWLEVFGSTYSAP